MSTEPILPVHGENSTRFSQLMQILSVPRQNGTTRLKETRIRLSRWLSENGISHRLHTFRLYPYFTELGGLWLIITQLLLAAAIWLRLGWTALIIALVSIGVIMLETAGVHLVSRLISDVGENIVLEFVPTNVATHELLLSAHYDSKNELLDDKQRAFLMGKLPLAMAISLLLGALGTLDWFWHDSAGLWSTLPYWIGVALTVPQLLLFIPLGINFLFGRWAPPSQGAIDNGAACAILLDLARQLRNGEIELSQTLVTIVLFSGEEVVVQGSRSYVADRDFPLPTRALNLELMGQNGAYVIWEVIGSPLKSYPADHEMMSTIEVLVQQHTGTEVRRLQTPAGTDTLPFLANGIASACLGSLDKEHGFAGLHSPADNVNRVYVDKLEQSAAFLAEYVRLCDGRW